MTTICTTCATAPTNADDSVWDDATPEERADIDASVEALGVVTLEPYDHGGYYTCSICSQTNLGTTYTTN